MNYCVVIHRRAMTEIMERVETIAKDNPAAAMRWYEGVLAAIKSLQRNPDRFGIAMESRHLPITLRERLYGKRQHKYRIVYSIRPGEVHIWTVRHAARDWLQFEDLLGEGS